MTICPRSEAQVRQVGLFMHQEGACWRAYSSCRACCCEGHTLFLYPTTCSYSDGCPVWWTEQNEPQGPAQRRVPAGCWKPYCWETFLTALETGRAPVTMVWQHFQLNWKGEVSRKCLGCLVKLIPLLIMLRFFIFTDEQAVPGKMHSWHPDRESIDGRHVCLFLMHLKAF